MQKKEVDGRLKRKLSFKGVLIFKKNKIAYFIWSISERLPYL